MGDSSSPAVARRRRRRRRRRRPLSKYTTTSSQTNNQHITKKTPHEPLKKRVLYYLHLYHFCCHLKSRPVKRTVNYTHKKRINSLVMSQRAGCHRCRSG